MITPFYQIECDGCGDGSGGVFRDLAAAEALREALGWVRIEYPPAASMVPVEAVRHLCPRCFLKCDHPEPVRIPT